jgi:putative transposase
MRKKREFIEGAYYHVTSRTNDKIRVFENKLGRKIMLLTLQDAKNKFRFRLANFCIMPTHIHLLIQPQEGITLSIIMQWLKTRSAKRWNTIHGSTDHMWGNRYFAREIKDREEYQFVMNYIDQNPVVAGLAPSPESWKASGAFYKANNVEGLVDFDTTERRKYIKLLSPIPPAVSCLMPPAQLAHISQYYGAYADTIERLYTAIKTIPLIGDIDPIRKPIAYFHYTAGAAEYFIYEYDGNDTMYGKVRYNTFPYEEKLQQLILSGLKKNELLKLDLTWVVPGTKNAFGG